MLKYQRHDLQKSTYLGTLRVERQDNDSHLKCAG